MRWDQAGAKRFADRRRCEDEAPRLTALVPKLGALRFEVEEAHGTVGRHLAHIRHIVIARAPARFFLACGDPNCRDGGHELTQPVLDALQRSKPRFEIVHSCGGQIRGQRCWCTLYLTGVAEYCAVPAED